MINFFFALLYLLISWDVAAYTQFVGHGYRSCVACHYSPLGGGPLNDYGRGASASFISGKLFYPNVSDEKIAQYSGFVGKPLPYGIRPSIDYRHLKWTNDYGEPTEEDFDITMTTDFNLVINPVKWVYGSYTYSTYPEPEINSNKKVESNITREALVGITINDQWRIMGGIFDPVFGLKIPDHIAFSRVVTGLQQNDQTLGAALHFRSEDWETALHLFSGNIYEQESEKQSGFSGTFEYSLNKEVHLGGSFLKSSSELLEKTLFSVHGRFAFDEGSSLISEIGRAVKAPENGSPEITNTYALMQSYWRLYRGIYFSTLFEVNDYDNGGTTELTTYRMGPGLHFFPVQRIEIKIEAANARTSSNQFAGNDAWDVYTNFHLYF